MQDSGSSSDSGNFFFLRLAEVCALTTSGLWLLSADMESETETDTTDTYKVKDTCLYTQWRCRMECCFYIQNRRVQFQPARRYSTDTQTSLPLTQTCQASYKQLYSVVVVVAVVVVLVVVLV